MGLDYYGILSLKRSCTLQDIQNAFRRLAVKFFPGEQRMMCLVAEAYEVLADPSSRALFDQLGEEALKAGVVAKPYVYHGQPLKTLESFFGASNPFENLIKKTNNPLPINKSVLAKGHKKQDPDLLRDLPLTLEEVFYGGVKKLLIRRLEFCDSQRKYLCARERILSVPIEPGVLAGTRLVFNEQGDQGPTNIPANVVVVIQDRPHERFVRSGNDLLLNVPVSLRYAMSGVLLAIHTLDRRVLHVRLVPPLRSECTKTIEEEGLPIPGDNGKRGDLIVVIEVNLPSALPKAAMSMLVDTFKAIESLGLVYEKTEVGKKTEDGKGTEEGQKPKCIL